MKQLLILCLLVMSLSGCAKKLNDNAPNYIKDVVALKEGSEGIKVYFVLCDILGNMTTANGTVHLMISQPRSRYSDNDGTLYDRTFTVQKDNFQLSDVGMGSFQHEAVLYLIGRIDYSYFSMSPSASTGRVWMSFTTRNGEILRGETVILF